MPLDNKIWIFGSWFGGTYNDNSRYIFEYVHKNFPDIKAVWLSRKKEIVSDLRNKGFRAYTFYSPIGLWYALRSGVAIFSVGYTADLPGFCISSSKKLIQLWHGIGVKKVGTQNTKAKDTNQRIFPDLRSVFLTKVVLSLARKLFGSTATQINHLSYKLELYHLYTYLTALSPTIKKIMVQSFSVPKDQTERVIITGIPRNDVLFLDSSNNQSKVALIIKSIHKQKGVVGFYMPTHRQEGGENMMKTIVDNLRPYLDLLVKYNIHLLIKLHQFHQYESLDESLKNITFISQKDLDGDVYNLLPMTDFLITDYSTVYIDYLLLDKPIIFLNYDLERYTSLDRELYFPYDEITPGPKVTDWKNLIPAVYKEVKKDGYKKDRQKIRELFHTYPDGNSSKRIAEKIYNNFVLAS